MLPTAVQLQNMAAAIVIVGVVSAIGYAIAVTVEWAFELGRSCLTSERRVRGHRG